MGLMRKLHLQKLVQELVDNMPVCQISAVSAPDSRYSIDNRIFGDKLSDNHDAVNSLIHLEPILQYLRTSEFWNLLLKLLNLRDPVMI
jgi:hypothetical protein